jgi:hypothetical protein
MEMHRKCKIAMVYPYMAGERKQTMLKRVGDMIAADFMRLDSPKVELTQDGANRFNVLLNECDYGSLYFSEGHWQLMLEFIADFELVDWDEINTDEECPYQELIDKAHTFKRAPQVIHVGHEELDREMLILIDEHNQPIEAAIFCAWDYLMTESADYKGEYVSYEVKDE